MQDNFEVSIILPTYNAEKYLEECLESLVSQTFRDIQIIFVDDKSTDRSVKIIDAYAKKDARIALFCFDSNCGPSVARNFGLDRAVGKYVFFMDPDDVIPEDAIENLYQQAEKCNSEIVRGNGQYFDISAPDVFFDLVNVKKVTSQELQPYPQSNFHGLPWYHILFLYNREFLINNNLRYPDIRVGEDPVFLLEVMLKAKHVATIESCVYQYRTDATHVGHFSSVDKVRDHFKHLISLKNMWLKNGMAEEWNSYFTSSFWWPWEKYILPNLFSFYEIEPLIYEVFSSVSDEVVSELTYERKLQTLLAKNHKLFDEYATLDIPKSESEGLFDQAVYSDEEVHALTQKITLLEEELAIVKSSRTWAMTRPFRKVYRFVQRYTLVRDVKQSELFDEKWYSKTYQDVAQSKYSAAYHYCNFGWKEGRDPSKNFSTTQYLLNHPQLIFRNMNPISYIKRYG